jgi:hypothetical protein
MKSKNQKVDKSNASPGNSESSAEKPKENMMNKLKQGL